MQNAYLKTCKKQRGGN